MAKFKLITQKCTLNSKGSNNNDLIKNEQKSWIDIFQRHANTQEVYKNVLHVTNQRNQNQNHSEVTLRAC